MDKRLLEQIEACRAGSLEATSADDLPLADDLSLANVIGAIQSDPQARQFFERSQAWDAAIGQTMEQVPVPDGLADRILARLTAADNGSEALAGSPADPDSLLSGSVTLASDVPLGVGEVQAASVVQRGWLQKHWRGSTVSAIGAAVLVGLVAHAMWPAGELELDQLADQWQQELSVQWQNDLKRAPADYPLPGQLRVQPGRWQAIGKFPGSRVIAFELVHPQAGKATLYVARMHRPGVPQSVPDPPQSQTGSRAVGYWRSGGLVYVLVTPGDLRSYRAFVEPSSAPLAQACPTSRASLARG